MLHLSASCGQSKEAGVVVFIEIGSLCGDPLKHFFRPYSWTLAFSGTEGVCVHIGRGQECKVKGRSTGKR